MTTLAKNINGPRKKTGKSTFVFHGHQHRFKVSSGEYRMQIKIAGQWRGVSTQELPLAHKSLRSKPFSQVLSGVHSQDQRKYRACPSKGMCPECKEVRSEMMSGNLAMCSDCQIDNQETYRKMLEQEFQTGTPGYESNPITDEKRYGYGDQIRTLKLMGNGDGQI